MKTVNVQNENKITKDDKFWQKLQAIPAISTSN